MRTRNQSRGGGRPPQPAGVESGDWSSASGSGEEWTEAAGKGSATAKRTKGKGKGKRTTKTRTSNKTKGGGRRGKQRPSESETESSGLDTPDTTPEGSEDEESENSWEEERAETSRKRRANPQTRKNAKSKRVTRGQTQAQTTGGRQRRRGGESELHMLETPGPSSERSEDRSEGSREEEEAPIRRGARQRPKDKRKRFGRVDIEIRYKERRQQQQESETDSSENESSETESSESESEEDTRTRRKRRTPPQRNKPKRKKLTKKQAAVKAPPESEGESSGRETPTPVQEDGSEDENRTPENNGAARKLPTARSSERIRKRKNRVFHKPTRREVFEQMDEGGPSPQKSATKDNYVGNFTRETHDYNQDVLTENEGSSLSSFINDGETPDSEWEEDGGGSPVNEKPDRKRKVSKSHTSRIKNREPSSSEEEEVIPPKPKFRRLRLRHTSSSSEDAVPLPVSAGEDMDDLPDIVPEHTVTAEETRDTDCMPTDSVRGLDDPIAGPSGQVKTESVESNNDIPGPSNSAPGTSDSAPGPSNSTPGPSNSSPESANVALGSTIKIERSEDIVHDTTLRTNECTCDTSHRESDSVRELDDPIAGLSVQVKTESVPDALSGVGESINHITGPYDSAPGVSDSAPGPYDSALEPSVSALGSSGNAPGPSESTRGPSDSLPESINAALGSTIKIERSEDIEQDTIWANECTCDTSHRETDSVRGLDGPITGSSVQVKTENVSDACSVVRELMNDIPGPSDSAPGPSDSAPGPSNSAPGPSDSAPGLSDSAAEFANVALGSTIKMERSEDIVQETSIWANDCTCDTSHRETDRITGLDDPIAGPSVQVKTENVSDAFSGVGELMNDIPGPSDSAPGPSNSAPGPSDSSPEFANVALGSTIKIERSEDILQETTSFANGCIVGTSGASDSVSEGDLPVSATDVMGQKDTDRIPEPANSTQGPSDSIQGHNDDIPIKTEPAEGPTDTLPVCRATQDTNGSPRGLPVVPGHFGYFPDPKEIIPLHFTRSPRPAVVITGTTENNQRPVDSTSIPRPTDKALGSINGVQGASGAVTGTSETVPWTTGAVTGTTGGFPGTTGTVLGNTASSPRPLISSPGPTDKLPKPTEAVPGPSFVTHPTDIICDPYNSVPGPSVSDTHPSIQGSTDRALNLQDISQTQSPNNSFPGFSDISPRHTDIAPRVTENIIGPANGVQAAGVETPGAASTTPGNTEGLEARSADVGPHTGVAHNEDNDNHHSDEGMFPNDDVDDIIAQIETEEKKHEEDKQEKTSNAQQLDTEQRRRITYQQQILNSNRFSSDGAQSDAPHNVFIMTFCTGGVSNPQDEDAGSLIITSSEETDDEDPNSVNLTSNKAHSVNITSNRGRKTDLIPPRNVPEVQVTERKLQSGANSSLLDGDRRLPSCNSLRESWGPREGAEVNVREMGHRDWEPSTSNNVTPGQSSRSGSEVPLTRNEVRHAETKESPPEEGTQSDEEMPTRRKLNRSVVIVSDDENDLNITVINTAQGKCPTPKTTGASNSQDSDSDTIPCDSDHEEEETPARRKTNRSLVIHSDEDEEDDVQIVSSNSSESESDSTQRDENGNEKTGEVPSDSGSEESGGSSRGSGEEEEGSGGSSGDSSSSEEDVRGNSKRARVMRSKKDAWREKFERYRNARRKSKGEDKGQD